MCIRSFSTNRYYFAQRLSITLRIYMYLQFYGHAIKAGKSKRWKGCSAVCVCVHGILYIYIYKYIIRTYITCAVALRRGQLLCASLNELATVKSLHHRPSEYNSDHRHHHRHRYGRRLTRALLRGELWRTIR